jgi:hypothetical protein
VVRLGAAASLLGGNHHSLFEVMMVCAPLVGCAEPTTFAEMVRQLVPHKLQIEYRGLQHCLSPEEFDERLACRLESLK